MATGYIDLNDVQGNIVKGYGRYGYPKARYLFFRFTDPYQSRYFVRALYPLITNACRWPDPAQRPPATTNIAFSYQGLVHLGLPVEALHSFPEEFSMGMKARADILGDNDSSAPENWDPIWQEDKHVHMFMSINAQNLDALERRYNEIQQITTQYSDGVQQLFGHRNDQSDDAGYQQASALFINGQPTAKEHFGFVDGISNPVFKGTGDDPDKVIGAGKPTRQPPDSKAGWEPLATGEFLLGYPDEAQELPVAPVPRHLSMNGTFMVYRKLHQNVGSFNRYLREVGQDFPGGPEHLAAKLTGRWRNGAPISEFPDAEQADKFIEELNEAQARAYQATDEQERAQAQAHYQKLKIRLTGFNFNQDIDGARCPLGAHIRRVNPRGSLEHGKKAFATPGALVDRRRILRRGLPYGEVTDSDSDTGDHGIILMVINASIRRQFEFVQQQWVNYGNDYNLANDKDPICGNQEHHGAMTIQGSSPENPPFICPRLPRFVDTRGGEYFFIPSLTAIRMIADGLIDPT